MVQLFGGIPHAAKFNGWLVDAEIHVSMDGRGGLVQCLRRMALALSEVRMYICDYVNVPDLEVIPERYFTF